MVAELEARRPPLVITAPGVGWDGLTHGKRHPTIADYLKKHYRDDKRIGPFVLMRRVEE